MGDRMTRILFVCHGNICRSVAAQYIFQKMVNDAHEDAFFLVDSAAVSSEEIGNPVYPPMRSALEQAGVPVGDHRARRLRREDYAQYDLFIGMDEENMEWMKVILGRDDQHKIHNLMEYTNHPDEVIDEPWYTRKFAACTRQITEGCRGLWQYCHQGNG